MLKRGVCCVSVLFLFLELRAQQVLTNLPRGVLENYGIAKQGHIPLLSVGGGLPGSITSQKLQQMGGAFIPPLCTYG